MWANSHGGQGMQSGEGSRGDAGDPVVVQRQQAHGAQTRECAVVDAADLVTPQHSEDTQARTNLCLVNTRFSCLTFVPQTWNHLFSKA